MNEHSHTMEDEYTYVCGCGELAGCFECGEEWHDSWTCNRVWPRLDSALVGTTTTPVSSRGAVQGASQATPGVGTQVAKWKRAYVSETDLQGAGIDPSGFEPAFVMKSGKWYSKDDVIAGLGINV